MLFIASELREFTRNKARGYKKLIIDEGVDSGVSVDFSFTEDGIHAKAAEVQENIDSEDTEYTFIVDKFGVYGNISSDIEVLLCDEHMLVTLKSGAIIINLNGNFMLASRHIADESLPAISPDKMYWVDAKCIRENAKFWLNDLAPMVDDFIINLSCRYQGGKDRKGVISNGVGFIPAPENERFYDVSNGAADAYLQHLSVMRQREEARDFMKLVNSQPKVAEDDFVFDPSEYEDDDEDDSSDEDDLWM